MSTEKLIYTFHDWNVYEQSAGTWSVRKGYSGPALLNIEADISSFKSGKLQQTENLILHFREQVSFPEIKAILSAHYNSEHNTVITLKTIQQ